MNNDTSKRIIPLASCLFLLSGFTALAFQVVLNKYFSYIFGVGSYAVATVLAAFMLGLACGSWAIGRLSENRIKKYILWYGILEVAIGVYALCFIPIADVINSTFTTIAREGQWTLTGLTFVRFIVAIVLIGIPTFLMGGSLPLLAEGLKTRGCGGKLNLLYGINIVGAAAGVVSSTYLIVPNIHLHGTLKLVFAFNLLILMIAAVGEFVAKVVTDGSECKSNNQEPVSSTNTPIPYRLVFLAILSGFLTFSAEVVFNHLLALVVGTSVYAYAIMLFTTLTGMAIGSFLVYRISHRIQNLYRFVSTTLLLFAGSVALIVPLWDRIPGLFIAAGVFIEDFYMRELVRFVACTLLILTPAIAAGATMPIIFASLERQSKALGRRIGFIYSVNTFGTIAGSLLTGFLLLEWLGGRASLTGLIVLAAVTAILVLESLRDRMTVGVIGGLIVVLNFATPDWDPQNLLSGANIYYGQAHDGFDEVIWQNEDHSGGVTSIIRKDETITMLTNGKFQGNNSREMKDQIRFALIPNLFVKEPVRALNIGLGTGVTLGAIGQFDYKQIDGVEIAKDIVYAGKTFFKDVNFNIFEDPRVNIHLQDGRNFLALNPEDNKYDLISIELTSIWFAGAGNLYNDEFYKTAKQGMTKDGVIQQWLQLHHISSRDIASILKTMRKHFNYVQLWLPGHQGIIVASDAPLTLDPTKLQNGSISLNSFYFLEEPLTVIGELLLTTKEIDAFIGAEEHNAKVPLSTDQNLYLEYSTPRGNALGWNLEENVRLLAEFSKHDPNEILTTPVSTDDLAVIELGRLHLDKKNSNSWHRRINTTMMSLQDETRRTMLQRKLKSL